MLEGLQVDLRAKFGPLSSLQLTLRRCQKIFVLWGWPLNRKQYSQTFCSILQIPTRCRIRLRNEVSIVH